MQEAHGHRLRTGLT